MHGRERWTRIELMMRMNLHFRHNHSKFSDLYTAAESKAKHTTEMGELHNTSDTKSLSKDGIHRDRSAQRHSEGLSTTHATTDHREHGRQDKHPSSRSSGPASAPAVNAVMGPPPPEDKKVSRRERWRQDRREAREMDMPSDVGKLGMWSAEDGNEYCANAYFLRTVILQCVPGSGLLYCSEDLLGDT